MKSYGAMKATEFTKKQINVLYGKAKNKELTIRRWVMSELYDLADYYDFDYNGSVADCEQRILAIIEAMFRGDLEICQREIDDYTSYAFARKGEKARKALNLQFV